MVYFHGKIKLSNLLDILQIVYAALSIQFAVNSSGMAATTPSPAHSSPYRPFHAHVVPGTLPASYAPSIPHSWRHPSSSYIMHRSPPTWQQLCLHVFTRKDPHILPGRNISKHAPNIPRQLYHQQRANKLFSFTKKVPGLNSHQGKKRGRILSPPFPCLLQAYSNHQPTKYIYSPIWLALKLTFYAPSSYPFRAPDRRLPHHPEKGCLPS